MARSMAYDLAYPDSWTREYGRPITLTSADVGKVARQFDNGTYWRVVSVDEQTDTVVWEQLRDISYYIVYAASAQEETDAFNNGALIVIRTDLL